MSSAQNGSLPIGGGMPYIRFGRGEEVLILLPGVGDSFKTVSGMALPFSLMYRTVAKRFRVFSFSRRLDLPADFTTADMADDLAAAMEMLDIRKAHVVGISQGGMIAQQLALRHPDLVDRLVLVVTAARHNPVMRNVLGGWLTMAEQGDYRGILLDTAYKSYSPRYLKTARRGIGLAAALTNPKSFRRFVTQCRACLGHDVYDRLGDITCPTLILGGQADAIVTSAASEEMAARIPDSTLYMYEGLGHGLYEEAKDFEFRIIDFLTR